MEGRDMHPAQECAGCFIIKACGSTQSASAVLTHSHGKGWEQELPQAVVPQGAEWDFQSCASCNLRETFLDSKKT